MNYNYQNYGYNNYPNYNQNQQYQNPQQMGQNLNSYNNYHQQMQQQQNNTGSAKCDYVNVSNIEEAKAYLVHPNQCVVFNDTNNKLIYIKKSDFQGISKISVYQEINLDQPKQNNNVEYVSLNDFNAFKKEIESKINDCVQKTQNMNSKVEN